MRTISLFWMMLTLANANAQDYVPMAVEGATWVMKTTDHYMNPVEGYYALRIEGDTMVNNLMYSQVYYYEMRGPDVLINRSRMLTGLIRDDIPSRQVFGMVFEGAALTFATAGICVESTPSAPLEHLLYDFGAELGDTLDNCILVRDDEFVFTSEEMQNHFGFDRRAMLSESSVEVQVEGIGLAGRSLFVPSVFFVTYFSNDLINYCVGELDECSFLTSTKSVETSEFLKLYPNPATDFIYVESEKELVQVSLISASGSTLRVSTESLGLDVSMLPAGLYFLRAEDEEGRVQVERVVKL